uniref:Uncharacterized protein n=1 Tax=Arundo donax TaxID=35708 RepID=A0A0A9AX28_ARUDO
MSSLIAYGRCISCSIYYRQTYEICCLLVSFICEAVYTPKVMGYS